MQSVYLQRIMKKNADRSYEKTKPIQTQTKPISNAKKGGGEMLRWASIIFLTLGISPIRAVEPFHPVLTDVEQNIYKETFLLAQE